MDYFETFWRRLGAEDDIPNFIMLIVLSFISFGTLKKSITNKSLLIFIILSTAFYLTSFVYPVTADTVNMDAFSVICTSFIFLLIGEGFKIKEFSFWLSLLSRLAVVINIVFLFVRSSSGEEAPEEAMRKAYILLPSILFLFWRFMEEKRLMDLFFCVLGFVIVCSMGSRGPFVCFFFFAGAYMFFFREYRYPNVVRICIVAACGLIFLVSEYVALFMVLLLSQLGMSTRIFDKMLEDSLINYESSSGRDQLHQFLFNRLATDTDGIGFGLYADRLVNYGSYSHNIFVELWFSFGYFIGSVIIGLFICYVIYFFCVCRDRDYKIFALLLFTVSFVKLNFSGTFMHDSHLFFFLGFCIKALNENNRKRINYSVE